MVSQGRLEEAGRWLELAERDLPSKSSHRWDKPPLDPRCVQLSRGSPERALDEFRAAERLARIARPTRPAAWMRHCPPDPRPAGPDRARRGRPGRDRRPGARHRGGSRWSLRAAAGQRRSASGDPHPRPRCPGSIPPDNPILKMEALLLDAIARDASRRPGRRQRALELALELAEPDRMLYLSFSIRRRNSSARPGTAASTAPSSPASCAWSLERPWPAQAGSPDNRPDPKHPRAVQPG